MEDPFYKTIIAVESSDFESIISKKQQPGRLIDGVVGPRNCDETSFSSPSVHGQERRNPATQCARRRHWLPSQPVYSADAATSVSSKKVDQQKNLRIWVICRDSGVFNLFCYPVGFLGFEWVGFTAFLRCCEWTTLPGTGKNFLTHFVIFQLQNN